MANDARTSSKVKDNENNSSKEIAGKPSTDGVEASNASGLRRSGRETPKKTRCPSPPSSRKSDRLEKRTPTPPVMRKPERVEKQSTPNALRRSERGKKQSSSSSSGSKKSNKSLDLSVTKTKFKKEKSVRQLTLETKKISKIEKEVTEPAQMGKNKMDARAYKAIFEQKGRKNVPGIPSKDVDRVKESGEKKVQDLREVSAGKDLEKASEESNCSVSKHPNETLEINIGQESSCSSQNISSVGACRSEDGDSVKDSEGGDSPVLSAYKRLPKKLVFDAETAKNNLNSELVNTKMHKRSPDSDIGLESGYKERSLKRKKDKLDPDSDATAVGSTKDICTSVTDATAVGSSKDILPSVTDAFNSFASGKKLAETCATCFKRQRDNHGSKQQDLCSCGSNSNQIIYGAIVSEEGNGADVTAKRINNLQHKDSPEDIRLDCNPNICLTCKAPGKLLCCDGKGCKRSYHVSCLVPPFKDVPFGAWYCLACVKKKIKLGAHSVSEGIESIWKVEMSEENGLQKKQFFVKYKGLAHVYNSWVSESLLLLEAPSLVAKFNRKNQISSWKEEWTEPHRMLQKRLLRSPKELDNVHEGHVDDVLNCHYQWLVKWRGLDYEKATWELENASFMKLPKAQSLIRDYENRLERAKNRTHKENEIEKGSVKPMQLSAGGSSEIDNNHLDFSNSLREQWHKGQNAIIIDDLERIMKVVTFIASLSSDGCWPFLIITSSDASLWDDEFSRLAPSIAAVVYHGNKDVRRKIRALEFYEEGGGVMFDVLITSPEAVVEDLDVLPSIKWEAMIVDECQRPRIFSLFGHFKSLSTKMRLLLVNGQLKDGIIEHLLPLLDCQSDRTDSAGLIANSDHRIRDLKEKLSKYIIDGSKSDTSRFTEYWVPVQISNPQLEQYCATLLSNSLPLCSSSNSKNDPVGAFRDIVISSRKCCDHPYITDSLLAEHLTKDLKVTDFLDVGIKASGKLQLLEAMLLEIRNRGLRVLILFQSSGGSGKDKVGDILDDFVRQRFGDDSYERVDGLVNPGRKQTALYKFNNQKTRFVFLLETRACLPSIKLSSVDTVVIFSSDWNPANDLRSLQKITLDTQSHLKIFRLYSSFTVEENALILAKQSKPLDSNLQSISRATSHNLLMWGVSYLFCKLDEFHSCCTLATGGSTSLETVSHEDIIQDFLTRLTQNAKDYTSSNSSIILKAKQNQGNYSTDFPLPGEQKIQVSDADLPHIFWKKLLGRKQPRWKYTSGLSQWNRKRVQHRDEILGKADGESEGIVKKRKKVANNNVDQTSVRSAATENEGGLGAVPQCVHRELNSGSTTHLNASNTNHISNLPNVAHNKSELREVDIAKFGERIDVRDSQKSLHALLKPEIAKLCEILGLPEDVKAMAQSFLEYVMNNHYVIKEPATVLQAFHISLCWTAASTLKYKIDHKESFELAKQHLDFGCRKEEADYVYSMLKCLKKIFLYHRKNLTPACSPSSLQQNKRKLEDLARGQESVDDDVLSELGKHAFSRSIQDIKKRCDKQMTKLLQKQQEETEESKRKYENEKAQLENKKNTEAAVIRLHSSSSMRADKLRQLDIEYKKKLEELNCQMEMDLKNVQKMHIAAREKVEKKKETWLQAVITWAKKDFITEIENDCSLSSHLKKQKLELMESMQDREVQVEVPESVNTSDDVEVLITGVLSTGKQNLDGVKSYMPDGEVPLREQDGEVAVAVVNRISNSSDKTTGITQENEDTPSGILEISGGVEVGDAREQHNLEAPSVVCKTADAVKANETSDQLDKISQSLDKSDGEVLKDKTIVNEILDFSERITVVTQENEDSLSGLHEIAGQVEGDETREQQDVEAPSAVPKTAEIVKVTESAPEDSSAGGEISGVRVMGPTLSTRPIQEDEIILSENMENDLSLVEGDSSGKEIDGVSAVNTEDNPPLVSSLVHQEQCVQQTTSTRLQDRVPSAIDMLNPLQQFEPLVRQEDVAFDQTNTDAPIVDHVLQMSSTDSAFSPNAMDLPSASEYDHPSGCEGNINTQSSTQMEHSNQAVSHLPVQTHLGGSGMHLSDTRTVPMSSLSAQTGPASIRIPPMSFCHDPLENELERIRKETDLIISIHEDTKLRLKSDCEKEIEEIRRKCETKLQEMESDFLLRKKGLDENHSTVLMNKILAQAFRSKCMDIKGSSVPGLQQDVSSSFFQQLLQLSNAQRNLSGPSSTGGPQIANPSSHSAAPPLRPVHHSSAPVSAAPTLHPVRQSSAPLSGPVHHSSAPPTLRPGRQSSAPVSGPVHHSSAPASAAPTLRPVRQSSAPVSGPVHHSSAPVSAAPSLRPVHHSSSPTPGNITRPPLIINSITPAAGNVQKSSEIRAPAPHLQPFRPAASGNSSSPAVGMLNQQVSSNPATTPTTPSQPQLRPQPAAQQSHPHPGNGPHQREGSGILPTLSSSAVNVLDSSLMDEDNKKNPIPSCSMRPQATDPAVSSEHGPCNTNQVVCLSDDD
ncbi:helicase protein MOM1 isoform X2 [Euphorbia lathyris]|uniref:helicase protein MOM1 isoform X2 n=1 Tax=Euphorbia lathyris TaxID=212925 RepID=UPI0033132B6E